MNFTKLFSDYKIEYSTKVNRGWINVQCPHCDDHSFNLGFNPIGDYCHCWKCGGHQLKSTLKKLLGVTDDSLDELLQQYQGRTSLLNNLNNKKTAKAKTLELPTNTFTKAERKYLHDRNFNPKYLHDKYGLVGGGISGDWKYRIIIPLIVNGKIVSWTGRSILDKQTIKELKIPRYKNLAIEKSVMDPKSTLFNMDNCHGDTVVLTEGAFDVMRLGDNFLCSFGTELTQAQVKELSQRYKKIYIMFDNEREAQYKAKKFGMQLSSMGVDIEVVDAYSEFNKNDGGELTDDEVKIIRKELGL